jgi:hypothetical protein
MNSLTSKNFRRPLFVEFRSQDTRRNLPKAVARKRTEANFLRSFERAYFAEELSISLAGREFALQGFGRADLVWLAWTGAANPTDFTALALKKRLRLTAIEAKMSDWRKGLQQAFRYSYFAHRSILVLPGKTAAVASNYIDTFRKLRVGLWGFDPGAERLRKWFTPRYASPIDRAALKKALHLIESGLKLGQTAKRL